MNNAEYKIRWRHNKTRKGRRGWFPRDVGDVWGHTDVGAPSFLSSSNSVQSRSQADEEAVRQPRSAAKSVDRI